MRGSHHYAVTQTATVTTTSDHIFVNVTRGTRWLEGLLKQMALVKVNKAYVNCYYILNLYTWPRLGVIGT